MRKNIVATIQSWLALAMMFVAASASAHHSAAGYDLAATDTAQATLKEFRWTSPHAALVFVIKGANGELQTVTLGGGAPGNFSNQGFKPKDFKVGDKMEVSWYPARNGRPGGLLATIKLPDGRLYKDGVVETLKNVNSQHFEGDEPK